MACRDCTDIYGFNKVEATRAAGRIKPIKPKLSWWDGHDFDGKQTKLRKSDTTRGSLWDLGMLQESIVLFTRTVEVQLIVSYGTLHIFAFSVLLWCHCTLLPPRWLFYLAFPDPVYNRIANLDVHAPHTWSKCNSFEDHASCIVQVMRPCSIWSRIWWPTTSTLACSPFLHLFSPERLVTLVIVIRL